MRRNAEMARARQRCVTCPPSQWRAIQDLARAAGMKTSPYILSRVLGSAHRTGLSAEQQRNLYARVNRLVLLCEDLVRPLPGSGVTLREAVSFLVHDQRASAQAATERKRRGKAGHRDTDRRPSAPDLFDEDAPE